MEEGVGRGRCGDRFDDELAGTEAGKLRWIGGEDEEGVRRAVLLGEAGLDGVGVSVEGGDGGGRWLGEEIRRAEKKKRGEEQCELACRVCHPVEFGLCGRPEQCKGGNAGQN
jgi:hypothetical protein